MSATTAVIGFCMQPSPSNHWSLKNRISGFYNGGCAVFNSVIFRMRCRMAFAWYSVSHIVMKCNDQWCRCGFVYVFTIFSCSNAWWFLLRVLPRKRHFDKLTLWFIIITIRDITHRLLLSQHVTWRHEYGVVCNTKRNYEYEKKIHTNEILN